MPHPLKNAKLVTRGRYASSLRFRLLASFVVLLLWQREAGINLEEVALASIPLKAICAAAIAAVSISANAQWTGLGNYASAGVYGLPVQAPGLNIQYEASAITWNRATNTLFVLGDGGRFVQQLSLTGAVIDSMSLALAGGPSRAGVEFDDPEGLAWVGGSTFVLTEERKRNAVRFDYAAGTTLNRSNTSTVTLGTAVGNTGLEGITYDGANRYILVNQAAGNGGSTQNIFQTSIGFSGTGGTASNGSATTVNAAPLFAPANIGYTDLNDVYALSNVAGFAGAAANHLLVLTNAGGLKEMTRDGAVVSSMTLPAVTPLGTAQIEGVTMDDRGYIYLVSDNGDFGTSAYSSSLFVYAPVPEPAAYGLLLAGLALLGAAARRRAGRA